MKYFYFPPLCPVCTSEAGILQFQYNGAGTMRLLVRCPVCNRDRVIPLDFESLVEWAAHVENLPTPEDNKLLHDLRVSWKDDATGHP